MNFAVNSSASVCLRLKPNDTTTTGVIACLERGSDTLTLSLSTGKHETFGSRRLRQAIKRLCDLDAAISYSLANGKSVTKIIPHEPNVCDGPHAAVEQIHPLLMPLKVSDEALYPYQRKGVAWLLSNKKALLGDDMGLGKTAQALAAVRRLIRYGTVEWVMIAAPRTLIANWVTEAEIWAPELTVSTAVSRSPDREEYWSRLVRRAHLLITSYEQLRVPPRALIENPPDLIVADEAHRLRKEDSQTSQGVRLLDAQRFWALTGTPIERDTEDLAVILSLLDPMRFSPRDRLLHTTSLRARARPYILRRRKKSVLAQLPEVIESHEILDLSDKQRTAYNKAISDHSAFNARMGFLPLFNELRMICDIDLNSGASTKLDRTAEIVNEIACNNEKVVVFSFTIAPLLALQQRLKFENKAIGSVLLKGDMSLEERSENIKSFKTNSEYQALLASTKVASEGLTLTEANHVIFINRWWNPSTNIQARDRVVRIGQQKSVAVISFTSRGTVEETLDDLLKKKSVTFEDIIESLSQNYNEYSDTLLTLA